MIAASNRQDYERVLAGLQAHLDEGAFASAWATGRALPFEQALTDALSGAGTVNVA
jgi:hypothetical protein